MNASLLAVPREIQRFELDILIIIYYSSCLYMLKLFKLQNSKFQFLVGHPKLYAEMATSSWKILFV